MNIYVVKAGDTVDAIAASQNIPAQQLIWENQIEYPYRLAIGQALFIGNGADASRRPLYSFGSAYPFISAQTLEETLPYLTDLYVFSYGFTEEGNLVYPAADDLWMTELAGRAGVRPVLTLTPLDSSGRFNNSLVSALVRDRSRQERLIWELGQAMQERGFGGLDFDFEYVLAEDRERYPELVALAARIFNTFGYPVSAALAPKTSSEQPGILYQGIDYRLLGEAADRVMLMTYEWGYSQGPPMAVAPIHQVRRVVEYAVQEILPEKLSLGIPNYGYDWPLPYERGVTRARTLSHSQALQLAIDFGAEIHFDETAQSPWFRYWQYGIQHEVWFEDVRSYKAKLDLIKEYGLAGAGYWQLMNFFRAGWLLQESMFLTERPLPLFLELDEKKYGESPLPNA